MAAIVLVGGSGRRMGRDKALLEIGGSTLVQMLVTRFDGAFGQVVVVARSDQGLAVERALVVHDLYRDAGPLAGLHAGLLASPDEINFVLACDMPFAAPELARYLISLLSDRDAVVPMLERGPEPLFAAYRKSALPEIESSLKAGRLRIRDTLDRLDVLYVPENDLRQRDPELRSFRNVNTPEDYEEALRMLRNML